MFGRLVLVLFVIALSGCGSQEELSPGFKKEAAAVIDANTLNGMNVSLPAAKRAVSTTKDAEIFQKLINYRDWYAEFVKDSSSMERNLMEMKLEPSKEVRAAHLRVGRIINDLAQLHLQEAANCRDEVLKYVPYSTHLKSDDTGFPKGNGPCIAKS